MRQGDRREEYAESVYFLCIFSVIQDAGASRKYVGTARFSGLSAFWFPSGAEASGKSVAERFSALLRNRRNTAQLLSVGCNKGHERVPMALNCVILRVLR